MIVRFVTLLNISPCQSAELRRLLERKSRGGNIQRDVWKCRRGSGPASLHVVEHHLQAVSRCKGIERNRFISIVILFKVILMERSSADAWYDSYVRMVDEYIERHRPRLHHLLPWLSKTHDNLSNPTLYLSLYWFFCSSAKLGAFNMILSSASNLNHIPLPIRSNSCSSVWKDTYTRHNAAVKVSIKADGSQTQMLYLPESGPSRKVACV